MGSFVAAGRFLSSCVVWGPEYEGSVVVACGLSSCGVWAPERMGSVVVACGLSSCGVRAQQLRCAGLVALRHVGS